MAAAKFLARRLVLAVLAAGGLLFAQQPEPESEVPLIPIEQATSRTGADFLPAFEGKTVRIAGQVSEKAFWNLEAFWLPVRDADEDFGILVRAADGSVKVQEFTPGDRLEAVGRIVRYAGMPVLEATAIRKTGSSEPVGSRQLSLGDAAGFRHLALPVEVEGRVVDSGDDGASEWIRITDGNLTLRVALPKLRRDEERRLRVHSAGERVRVNGVVTQHALLPPYDRFFEITLLAPDRVTLIEAAGMLPFYLLLSAFGGISLLAIIWWVRDQRNRTLRRIVVPLHALGEEILAASSMAEILKKIGSVAPAAARVSGVVLYLYDRKTRTLEAVRAGSIRSIAPEGWQKESQVSLDKPKGALHATLGRCFRNKSALSIPDVRRSDLFKQENAGDAPRSILALPMLAQDDAAGVMLLYREDGVRYFHHEEQASAQHLANQVAAALRALEQRSVREQLFKSEKLAATGHLIAGVVNDLRNPVESLLTLSQLLLFRGSCSERELRMLASEAQQAAEIVARLISFGRNEDAVAKPVEMNTLVSGMLKFREREWKSAGIQLQDRMSRDPVPVIGAQGQLEQVVLNILLYAERAVAESGSKIITVGTSLLGRRVLVDIDFPAQDDLPDPFTGDSEERTAGLAVLRGIIQSHGGEVRFERVQGGLQARIEIELPRAQQQAAAPVSGAGSTASAADNGGARSRPAAESEVRMTAIVIEPDLAVQRTFVMWMSQKGHRTIPVGSAEEAIDLVQRVKCDMVACTARMPGFAWLTFYERVREHTDGFVLLLDEGEIGHSFASGEGYVLRKPLSESDFDRVLDAVTSHLDEPFAQAG
jgi:signal transduction histidine kinase